MKYQNQDSYGVKEDVFMLNCMNMLMPLNALSQPSILLHNMGIHSLRNFAYICKKVSSQKLKNVEKYCIFLYQVFLVSEPFYGHVLSYLKLNNKGSKKLSMKYKICYFSQVWESAVFEIKRDIYRNARRKNISQQRLTAYEPYNQAFLKQ